MGDYIVTMDTGDQYLCHHGTKGMKWGKWNAETAARYAGGTSREAKRYNKGYEKHQTLKGKAERAADQYVTNPNIINKAKVNIASNKETYHNSVEAQRAKKRDTIANTLGGIPASAIVSRTYPQKVDNAKWKNQALDTRATRLEDALKRAQKSGFDASQKAKDYTSKTRRQMQLGERDIATMEAQHTVKLQNKELKKTAKKLDKAGAKMTADVLRKQASDKSNAEKRVNDIVNKKLGKPVVEEHQEASRNFQKGRKKSSKYANSGFREIGTSEKNLSSSNRSRSSLGFDPDKRITVDDAYRRRSDEYSRRRKNEYNPDRRLF